ncbi:MAG: DnaA/Hda family protein [Pirellulaceae bacterium]
MKPPPIAGPKPLYFGFGKWGDLSPFLMIHSTFTNGVEVVSGVFSIPLETGTSGTNGTDRNGRSRRGMVREFIGGAENRLVEFAVSSFCERNPRYNPLVLRGPTGTGKSFLALGLSERWRERYPEDTIFVSSGPDFAHNYANAVDTDDLGPFRKRCRSADLFVLDDIHFLPRKRAVQEELSRTIDALLEGNGSVLITQGGMPNANNVLLGRLRSRLLEGLTVPLTAPGPEARQLLVRRLAAVHGVNFCDTAIALLAGSSQDANDNQLTVPELNHAVVQLGQMEDTRREVVDIDRVRQFLTDRAMRKQPTIRDITALVAKFFSLTTRELRGPARKQHVIRARGVAMLLARHVTGQSLNAVGKYFGNRDHTTVLHACRRTEALKKTDPAIAKAWEEIRNQIKAI